MRIMLCSHQLPPEEQGGVGGFTLNLAGELARAGHQVTLLAGREATGQPGVGVVARRGGCTVREMASPVAGVQILRVLRSGGRHTPLGRFVATFTDRDVEGALRELLRDLSPEVVHIQHTLHLTARLSSLAIDSGAAVVATAHDFWPICQRIVLARPDGTPCPGPRGGLRCAGCLPPLEHAQDVRWIGPHGPHELWRLARRAGQRSVKVGLRAAPYLLRTQVVQGGYALAHRLTCPAASTADLLQGAGFDGSRMALVDYGIPPLPAGVATASRPRSPFRFGFLGTLGPHKGVWIALRAAEVLYERTTAPWRLTIHGGPLRSAELRGRLAEVAESTTGRVEYRGPYAPDALPGILADLDAVLIPSVWRETGPMVWMEALAAGLPVVASRVGALAERVFHGHDGLLVPPGDAASLAAGMEELLGSYDQLRRGALARTVRTVAQAAGELQVIYEEARALRRSS